MWKFCSRGLVSVGMVKPWNLVKPVSAALVAGRHLTQQVGLPTLPVPSLPLTCELYLSYLEPILEADELKHSKELVEEFKKAGGVGERLQEALERAVENMDNWYTDGWVNHFCLYSRKPLVANESYGMLFPRMDFRDKKGQIRYAAEFTAAALEVKTMIENKTLPVDYIRGKPLCMQQYDNLISACRIPDPMTDSLEFYGQTADPPKHISVVHNCQFFVLDAYNSDGTPLTVDQLHVQLERICNSSPETNVDPVGILTTEQRDTWGKTYINLIKDKTNKESVSAIQSSIFTVCLDGAMPPVSDEMFRNRAFLQLLHGGGSKGNSGNCWLDKTLQLVIGEDGMSGAVFFYGTSDGVVANNFAGNIIELMKKPKVKHSTLEPLPMPQKLHFNITPEIKKDIEQAMQKVDKLNQDLDLTNRRFNHFGKNFIKAHRLSPNAFVQMSLQLAYYRARKETCPTVQPVTLRTFNLGRITSFNPNLPASATFVKAFDDPEKQNSEKFDLLKKAIKTHNRYTDLAMGGQAVEMHLKSLFIMSLMEGTSIPDIFTDTAFLKAFDNRLLTSPLVSRNGCLPACGPDNPGAVYALYSLMDDHIELTLSTWADSNSCQENNAAHFVRVWEDSLLDMKTLLEQTSTAEA